MNGEFTAGPWGLKTANGFCFSPTRRNRSDGGLCAENWAFVCHYGNWFFCCVFCFPGTGPRMKILMVLFGGGRVSRSQCVCGCI